TFRKLQETLTAVDARVTNAQLNENDRQNISASLHFDVRREHDAKIQAALTAAGEVLTRSSARAQEIERVVDSKKRILLTLVNVASIPPRETYTLGIELDQVEKAVAFVEALVAENKGRILDSVDQRASNGQYKSRIIVDVPFAVTRASADRIKAL